MKPSSQISFSEFSNAIILKDSFNVLTRGIIINNFRADQLKREELIYAGLRELFNFSIGERGNRKGVLQNSIRFIT